MCGITGFIEWNRDLTKESDLVQTMTSCLEKRGPDAQGTWISGPCAFGHRRLSVMDPENGAQPMIIHEEDAVFTIVYNGEIYNAPELKAELQRRGRKFQTTCDTEVLLQSYIEWGPDCVYRLNGIFAFAVWDSVRQHVFFARDRLGVKPLFYSEVDGTLIFGSEPKAILQHPKVRPVVGAEGLAEIFVIGPARTPGHGVYKDLKELRPGHVMIYNRSGLRKYAYWKLEAEPHTDDVETTAAAIRRLLQDTLERQLISDVPVCTLLSGGLDSSALTALAVDYYKRTGQGRVHTYSIDYVDNDKHFKAHSYQPGADGPWIKRMVEELGTEHHAITFDTPELVAALPDSTVARDMPGMTDIDASLLLFCREIKKGATVAISGEAADEVFGGYPWFHREELLNSGTFPWSVATGLRADLLAPEIREWIKPEQYIADRYSEAVAEAPKLEGESGERARMRIMSYLNITRFMPTLLDRKDRMSMAAGLEVRVPYCDHRLVQYVWNIPWEIKTTGGREKGILRKALEGILPEDVLYRKKSPYPKTHNPNYLTAVRSEMLSILDDPSSPILPLIDSGKIRSIAASEESSSNLPWFGQLMSGPQLFAYLSQVNHWLKTYGIEFR
ncbi:MAG: asparagine synthase (glutamine-hydrolyzing) [Paenibacillus macerans]|uniref:asparagine synthase (glutamine-hydrolyzing) n=2 Tax=Paenibacillus macerans TaxID=44252 RepID=A0A6N8F3Q5_PAEMA|nr:asparagine synthase (glutamine-hydrolyzing) [Paenibacillus macerans]MBS5914530.1 asparagine synthase (glutamine-hydrolyzing) [Paenibacillus macerans]MDU7476296.1 asparagine synthase (glutamine-hydrolyzing) [Paenibacillus macerans]MEC0140856.1 asparagine synthase (glutamine-hydrolyzing) [Paenibacillus macerans]MEC0151897.1 asparagine synthase (glutamine-hydrolyzing) [Paenibacillus macerans]MUG26684.1 asparagine synthase (glutamine-hydrolyzing) [Paenibacillus macerans]